MRSVWSRVYSWSWSIFLGYFVAVEYSATTSAIQHTPQQCIWLKVHIEGFGKIRLWHSGLVNVSRDVSESEDELNSVENLRDHMVVGVFNQSMQCASYFFWKYLSIIDWPGFRLSPCQNACIKECNRHHCSIWDRRSCSKFRDAKCSWAEYSHNPKLGRLHW
jgi:hypothetical protein